MGRRMCGRSMTNIKRLLLAIDKDPEVGEAVAMYVSATHAAKDQRSVDRAGENLMDRIKWLVIKNKSLMARDEPPGDML